MRKLISWSQKEDQLIIQNFSTINSKKWKIIANILKENGYQKKETQCRQRYINHLAPHLDKNIQISAQELQTFYNKYQEYGPKWTLIQQFLPRKSQVQLKNIFYGNVRCFVKKIIKHFTNKTAVFVNKFNTFTLQNIYSGKRSYKGFTCLKEHIKYMNYRFNQDQCLNLIKLNEESYKNMLKILLDQQQVKKSKHYDYFRKKYIKNTNFQINDNNRSKRQIQQVYRMSQNIEKEQQMGKILKNQYSQNKKLQTQQVANVPPLFPISIINEIENPVNDQNMIFPFIGTGFMPSYEDQLIFYSNNQLNYPLFNPYQQFQSFNYPSTF